VVIVHAAFLIALLASQNVQALATPRSSAPAAQRFSLPDRAAVAAAPTFASGERVVATYYFYWYRYPGEHFDELTLHFPRDAGVSYESEAWHEKELEDMRAAEIDVCLPVYWGALDHYDKPDVAFSVSGLPALVAAADALERAGKRPPRIGMFYDTSTLRNDVRGVAPRDASADLRTPEGRALFYGTIRDFFCQVPPRHWAEIDGSPLVVLYSAGFAAGFDQRAFDELSSSFARDFAGKRPYVVRENSWRGVRTDAMYSWGSALAGAAIGVNTVAVGPGYDDSAVRGRATPIREREHGRFYEKSWRAALRSNAQIALVETWNENHEGTSVSETREYGREYIALTARYARQFKRHATVADDAEDAEDPEDIVLEWPKPRPRPDLSWGKSAHGATDVAWTAGGEPIGLRPVACPDGPFESRAQPEPMVVTKGATPAKGTYLYFQVADSFAFDVDLDFELELEFRDEVGGGGGAIGIEYDSRDASGTLDGAYTQAAPIQRTNKGGWRTATARLPHARFANRENGASDLRLCVGNTDLALRALRVRRKTH
jgi:hypothetical protein